MTSYLVLTTTSEIACAHSLGKIAILSSSAKLKVNSQSVLLKTGIEGKMITGCPISDSNTSLRCKKVSTITAGEATKLTIGQQRKPVMFTTLQGTTDGIPPATGAAISGKATQNKLKAV